MKKIVKLTESDLARIVRRVINEQKTHPRDNPLWSELTGYVSGTGPYVKQYTPNQKLIISDGESDYIITKTKTISEQTAYERFLDKKHGQIPANSKTKTDLDVYGGDVYEEHPYKNDFWNQMENSIDKNNSAYVKEYIPNKKVVIVSSNDTYTIIKS